MDNAAGVEAAVANHRVWFERLAAACGGAVERVGDLELAVVGDAAALPFPAGPAGLAATVERCRTLGLREVGCWAAAPDADLGALLRALGFQDGWQPHWMALDPRDVDAAPAVEVARGRGEGSPRLPYWSPRRAMLLEAFPDDVVQLVVRDDGEVLGETTLNLAGAGAGIFDMGVVPEARRRGFGLALALEGCRIARERGAEIVTLNATGEGEPVYRRAGFNSVGWGMTWWLFS